MFTESFCLTLTFKLLIPQSWLIIERYFFRKGNVFRENTKHLKPSKILCLILVFHIYPIITIVRDCWQTSYLNTCPLVKRNDVTAKIWFKVNNDSMSCVGQRLWSPTQAVLLSEYTDSNKIGLLSASLSRSLFMLVSECWTNITVCCHILMVKVWLHMSCRFRAWLFRLSTRVWLPVNRCSVFQRSLE
jgi:hypothetical protein